MARKTAQVKRIEEMSARLERAEAALRAFEDAFEEFRAAQDDITALEDYYLTRLWMKDYEADEAGKVPADINRGALSEDGIYNVITGTHDAHLAMLDAARAYMDR